VDDKEELKNILEFLKLDGGNKTEFIGEPSPRVKEKLEELGLEVLTIGGFIESPVTIIRWKEKEKFHG
jgi:hypothetical protein